MPAKMQIAPQTGPWSIEATAGEQVAELIRQTLPNAVSSARPQSTGLPMVVRKGVSIISMIGPMERSASVVGSLLGFSSTSAIEAAVREATADPRVQAIILRTDSPGGSVSGLAELADAVHRASKIKPVTAVVQGMAASAAFHVASQANRIFTGRMDLVGSIGTKLTVLDTSEAFAKAGVEVHSFTTGPLKDAGTPGTKLTGAQQEHFQSLVDAYFEDFVQAVQRGRGMSREAVMTAATGAVFPAKEAKRLGLIDGIRTIEAVIAGMTDGAGAGRMRMARAKLAMAEIDGAVEPSRAEVQRAAREALGVA